MLRTIIEKKKNSQTTLLSLYVVLEDYLSYLEKNLDYNGLEMKEIGRSFTEVARDLNIKNRFYPSYVQRQAQGKDDSLFIGNSGFYKINEQILDQINSEELKDISENILDLLRENQDTYSDFILQLDDLIVNGDNEYNYQFIMGLFEENGSFRNFGQVFEVLSYSILKVYFMSFGFDLRRFSVSFSNDGGMDFISSTGIYQVTASSNKNKIESDLSKLPGTERVLILHDCSDEIRNSYIYHRGITEIITSDELKSHFLNWLYKRGELNNNVLISILETLRKEMIRETS